MSVTVFGGCELRAVPEGLAVRIRTWTVPEIGQPLEMSWPDHPERTPGPKIEFAISPLDGGRLANDIYGALKEWYAKHRHHHRIG